MGTHYWPEASGDVAFLKHEHHHDFHIYVECDVKDNNRQIEFLRLRIYLKKLITYLYPVQNGIVRFQESSCEMISETIQKHLIKSYGNLNWKVYVSEDGIQTGGIW